MVADTGFTTIITIYILRVRGETAAWEDIGYSCTEQTFVNSLGLESRVTLRHTT